MPHELKEIKVYIIAEKFADYIWNLVKNWDRFDRDTVGRQMVRAADSISANIAENHGRFHFKDKQKFGYYTRGSLEETKCWLRKCHKRNLIEQKDIDQLAKYVAADIGPKLNSLINSYKYPVSKKL